MLTQRSLLGYIGLSIITLGIYGLYWVYAMTRDINQLTEDGSYTSPGLAVVLTLVTFGIYPLIWYFKQGNRLKALGTVRGIPVRESGGSYLLWFLVGWILFGLGPLIGQYKFLKNYSNLVVVYNHTIATRAASQLAL